ncbi:type II toxin-antitoxin system RelE/ParE family toxin [Pontiellaceae bacterium B1224]|nr:type II toxin-antitoxin system RelE/ParE family toxin [Pontiellaceae bacterium B1224]
MLPLEILHPAEIELRDAAKYYESKSCGLGADFLIEMEEAVQFIQEEPLRQPEREDHTRRVLTKRFPYQVIYTIHEEKIWVVAFSNQRQKTGYRQNRI